MLKGDIKSYELRGPLFFGAVTSFKEIFTPGEDPAVINIEFKGTRVYDHSALEAINGICAKYRVLGKTVILKNLSGECQILLNRAEPIMDVTIDNQDCHTAL